MHEYKYIFFIKISLQEYLSERRHHILHLILIHSGIIKHECMSILRRIAYTELRQALKVYALCPGALLYLFIRQRGIELHEEMRSCFYA